jgi:hypothetical protein
MVAHVAAPMKNVRTRTLTFDPIGIAYTSQTAVLVETVNHRVQSQTTQDIPAASLMRNVLRTSFALLRI